jgi:hypothetical protein
MANPAGGGSALISIPSNQGAAAPPTSLPSNPVGAARRRITVSKASGAALQQ